MVQAGNRADSGSAAASAGIACLSAVGGSTGQSSPVEPESQIFALLHVKVSWEWDVVPSKHLAFQASLQTLGVRVGRCCWFWLRACW